MLKLKRVQAEVCSQQAVGVMRVPRANALAIGVGLSGNNSPMQSKPFAENPNGSRYRSLRLVVVDRKTRKGY